jgi:hypothetical protein
MKVIKDNGIRRVHLTDEILKQCHFCGSKELELWNTHSPHYTIECECGAQINDDFPTDRKESDKGHLDSAKRVIEKWNTRI